MENPWKTINKRTVYENPWIAVTHREVLNPSGGEGIYGVVHFKNLAVGVVPLDDAGNTWLVGQYRYTLNRYSWEIPEGGCPVGTEPLDSAQRELLEETGMTARKWDCILGFDLSNSVTDETGMAYIARDLSFGEAQPEETEALKVKKVPFSEALEMVYKGEITDSLSIMALLRAKVWLEEGR